MDSNDQDNKPLSSTSYGAPSVVTPDASTDDHTDNPDATMSDSPKYSPVTSSTVSQKPGKSKKKKFIIIAIVVLIIMLLLCIGWHAHHRSKGKAITDQQALTTTSQSTKSSTPNTQNLQNEINSANTSASTDSQNMNNLNSSLNDQSTLTTVPQ